MRNQLDLERWNAELREVSRRFDELYEEAWRTDMFPELADDLYDAACWSHALKLYDRPPMLRWLLWRIEHSLKSRARKWKKWRHFAFSGGDLEIDRWS